MSNAFVEFPQAPASLPLRIEHGSFEILCGLVPRGRADVLVGIGRRNGSTRAYEATTAGFVNSILAVCVDVKSTFGKFELPATDAEHRELLVMLRDAEPVAAT